MCVVVELFQVLKVCLFNLVLFGLGLRCDCCVAGVERDWLRLVHGLAVLC